MPPTTVPTRSWSFSKAFEDPVSRPYLAAPGCGWRRGQRDFDVAGQPVSWQSFPLLQRMRGSLNFLWGRLLLQWAEEKADIAFYGCSENVGNTFISFSSGRVRGHEQQTQDDLRRYGLRLPSR